MENKNRIKIDDIPAAEAQPIPTPSPKEGSLNSKLKITMEEVVMPDKPVLNLFGIDETADAVKFITATANAVNDALKDDGAITLSDVTKFISPATKLPAALAGIGKIPAEVKDMTLAEKQELVTLVKDTLELDSSEEIVELALNIAFDVKRLADLIGAEKE
jgi:hypothetical protein